MVGNVNEQCCIGDQGTARKAHEERQSVRERRLVPMAATISTDTHCAPTQSKSYLLGLLAMIKCSICSYQCDN
jgi:hypothetical protein